VYGRIERFEGTDANRLDASEDAQRRVATPKRPARPAAPPVLGAGTEDARQADDGVGEPPRSAPR
jgi:hypothetical protein